jgi:hypothetical protein
LWNFYTFIKAISTQEKFPRTENFPKISLLKVENFQLSKLFSDKIFFLRKIFLSGNGLLDLTRNSCEKCNYRPSVFNLRCFVGQLQQSPPVRLLFSFLQHYYYDCLCSSKRRKLAITNCRQYYVLVRLSHSQFEHKRKMCLCKLTSCIRKL